MTQQSCATSCVGTRRDGTTAYPKWDANSEIMPVPVQYMLFAVSCTQLREHQQTSGCAVVGATVRSQYLSCRCHMRSTH